ncbi:unnamed protein product [Boreogadus saida]
MSPTGRGVTSPLRTRPSKAAAFTLGNSRRDIGVFTAPPLNITDFVLCIVKSAWMFVGLVCVVVCAIRTSTVKRAPRDEEDSQVIFGGEEDDYVNSGMQMNPVGPGEGAVGPGEDPVGPREDPVGPREEAVLRAGSPVSTHRDAASSRLIGPAGSHPGRPVSRELTEDTQ